MSNVKPQVLKGFRDYTPEMMRLRLDVIQRVRAVFERHGFEPIDTPTLEYLEILTGKAGENEKLMYHFADHGEREVGMRYDLTVPLARYFAMHQQESVIPFKRYHIGPVWRAEKPQRGRFREFWQCDADVVGTASMTADAECVSIMVESLSAVNLSQAVVAINSRKLLEAMARLAGVPETQSPTVFRSIDKLGKLGPDGVRKDLVAQGIEESSATTVINLATRTGTSSELLDAAEKDLGPIEGGAVAVAELRELVVAIEDLAIPENAWKIDLSMARGIDYYTGPVFEALVEEPKIGSVGGAGRYDGLVGTFLGRAVPATGMSLGLERILEVINEFDLLPQHAATAQVFVARFPDSSRENAQIASDLRSVGINTDLSLLANRGLGDQMKHASRRGIPFAVIAGPDDVSAGTGRLRDLANGDECTVPLDGLAEAVKMALATENTTGALA